jgi:hypothetical protein
MPDPIGVRRRAGSLQDLPAFRPDDSEEGARVIVQIRILTSDKREFARIARDTQRALQDAEIDGAAFVVTDESTEMTATEVKNVSQHVMPHILHTLGITGAAAARMRR